MRIQAPLLKTAMEGPFLAGGGHIPPTNLPSINLVMVPPHRTLLARALFTHGTYLNFNFALLGRLRGVKFLCV